MFEKIEVAEVNKLISGAILSETPFFAGRYGGSEMTMLESYIHHRWNIRNRRVMTNKLCELSGFFPDNLFLQKRFRDVMVEATIAVDLQAVWNWKIEEELLKEYGSSYKTTELKNIEPYISVLEGNEESAPWTASLKGKKVLVIHPFDKSIRYQYENNRQNIFSRLGDADLFLPEFELITLKAVQTIAKTKDKRFKTWFDALSWMEKQIDNIDFDVAIIGCGAYGYPLGAYIKNKGKVAIHIGGALQLLFGITGNRWMEEGSFVNKMANEFWKLPFEEEKPGRAEVVEGSCYW